MNDNIGETAGRVWQYLQQNGPATMIELKSGLEISSTLLCMTLGWLSREDKVDIAKSHHTYKISIK